jgi:glycosyltransferase involved in cell wall biosynthesis
MIAMKVCVILPALNEEKGIKKTIYSVPNPLVKKIVVVDGNSSDNTVEVAKKCKRSECDIQVMKQEGKGKGMAFQSFINNFDLDKYDVYVMLDADCTYDPKEIRKMVLPILNNEADVVMGNRFSDKNIKEVMPFPNYIGNRLLTFFATVSFFKNPRDVCTGYWAFSKDVLKKIKIDAKGFDLEMNLFTQTVKNNFRIKTLPVSYTKRVGETKLRKVHGISIFSKLIRESFVN